MSRIHKYQNNISIIQNIIKYFSLNNYHLNSKIPPSHITRPGFHYASHQTHVENETSFSVHLTSFIHVENETSSQYDVREIWLIYKSK
jgi:hypothetical protein